MIRLLLLIILGISADVLACRAPVKIDSAIIEISYLDTKGKYSIKIPAQIGDSKLGRAGLFFMKTGSSVNGKHEFGRELDLERHGASLIGEFSAYSKQGYDAFISARWPVRPCPAFSRKKIQLFPINSDQSFVVEF